MIEVGKIYEFMGEIESNVEQNSEYQVYLNARVLKTGVGFHKIVYQETTNVVNGLIEAIMTRNNNFKLKAKEEAEKKVDEEAAKMELNWL